MKFLGAYTDLIIFISYLWVLVLASLYVAGKYILPFFAQIKLGNFKITLGFYLISAWLLYQFTPILVPMNDKVIAIYNNSLNTFIQIISMVSMYYFGSTKEKKTEN